MVEGRREEKADSTDSRTRKKEEGKESSTPRTSSRVATKDVVGSNIRVNTQSNIKEVNR